MMVILGIQDNHGASAALLEDGQIVKVVEEEKLSRIKMDSGFPKNAVDYLRAEYGPLFNRLDAVAMATRSQAFKDLATKRYPLFRIKDFLIEEQRYWIPKLNGEDVDYLEEMKDFVDYKLSPYPLKTVRHPYDTDEVRAMRQSFVADYLGITKEKVTFLDHHACHAHHAYFSSPIRHDALVFTADGWGDDTNATVHIVEADGRLRCLYRTNKCNLGRIYQLITLLLGMKPAEHEYKVMGLAAYAKEHHIREVLHIFDETYYVDGLEFKIDRPISNHYQYFREKLEGYRFDAIAGALQRYVEKMMVRWVDNWLRHTGRSKVVFSGGLALNIKVSKRIGELPQVEDMFVSMAGGDESLPIGAAQKLWIDLGQPPEALQPITVPYIGPGFDQRHIREALEDQFLRDHYDKVGDISTQEIARLLVDGHIVAVMMGDMEFGPRALGNRSLLADPRDHRIVRVINEAIKNRDFWMPFTPSILAERAQDYLVNSKRLRCPYMTMAFDSTNLARKHLPAAIHPYDLTLRPQIVFREHSPKYYTIIKGFEALTGVGAVLNTSFNIHGKPIVRKPLDAVREVLSHELVDLRYVVFENILLKKKDG